MDNLTNLKLYISLRQLQEDFEFSKFDNIGRLDNVYFIIGDSRVGKSTLCLMLNNIPLQSKQSNGKGSPIVLDTKDQKFRDYIGHGTQSKTKMPNIFQVKHNGLTINLIDCPGLLDSQGFSDDFINSYFVMKVFQVVNSARFLFCISENQMKHGNISGLIKAISGYLKYFKPKTPNFEKIIEATSLVITKCLELSPQGLTAQAFLADSLKTLKTRKLDTHAMVLQKLVKSGRIYYIDKLVKPQKTVPEKLGKQILNQQAKNKMYNINKNIDIDFQIQVGSNPQEEQHQNADQKFLLMHTSIVKKLIQVAKIFKGCFEEIASSISKGIKTYKYINEIKKYLQENDIYNASSDKKQLRKNKVRDMIKKIQLKQQKLDFAEIYFLRAICDGNKNFAQKNRNNCVSLIKEFLKNIASFGYLQANSNHSDDMFNIAYLIKRNLEELMSIERMCPKITNNYRQIQDDLQISDTNVENYEILFINRYVIRNQASFEYLKATRQFFQQINIKSNNQNTLIRRKNLLLSTSYKLGAIQEAQKQWKMAFREYESARKIDQEVNAKKNLGIYSTVNTQLYFKLANICQKNLNFVELAIQYYKVIDYIKSIRQCFESLRSNKKGKELIQCFIHQAQYLSNINCPHDAKRILEQAIQAIVRGSQDELELRKKVKKLQLNLAKSQPTKTKNYQERIDNNELYNRPNESFIKVLQMQSGLI